MPLSALINYYKVRKPWNLDQSEKSCWRC